MIKNIERNIKQIRELKNVTQEFIAQQLGVSTRAYSKIETGETKLTIDRINQISKILEISPEEIIGFDEKQIFNNCKQEGNIGINHISSDQKLIQIYEDQLLAQKEEIQFLREQLERLLKK